MLFCVEPIKNNNKKEKKNVAFFVAVCLNFTF